MFSSRYERIEFSEEMNLLLFTKRFEVGGATLLVHPQVISFSLYDMFQEIKP